MNAAGSDRPSDVPTFGLRESLAFWTATASALLLLAVLIALVAANWPPLVAVDHAAVDAANAALAPHPVLVTVVRAVTDAGSPLAVDVVTGAAAIVLLVRRRWWPAVYLLVVRAVELGVEQTLKSVLDRPRPVPPVILATAQGASFPSGHTAGTAALCLSLVVVVLPGLRRGGRDAVVAVAVLATVAVAASRVLLGVHFPSDVAGGVLVGGLSAVASTSAGLSCGWGARRYGPAGERGGERGSAPPRAGSGR